jgi:hypothetical protein
MDKAFAEDRDRSEIWKLEIVRCRWIPRWDEMRWMHDPVPAASLCLSIGQMVLANRQLVHLSLSAKWALVEKSFQGNWEDVKLLVLKQCTRRNSYGPSFVIRRMGDGVWWVKLTDSVAWANRRCAVREHVWCGRGYNDNNDNNNEECIQNGGQQLRHDRDTLGIPGNWVWLPLSQAGALTLQQRLLWTYHSSPTERKPRFSVSNHGSCRHQKVQPAWWAPRRTGAPRYGMCNPTVSNVASRRGALHTPCHSSWWRSEVWAPSRPNFGKLDSRPADAINAQQGRNEAWWRAGSGAVGSAAKCMKAARPCNRYPSKKWEAASVMTSYRHLRGLRFRSVLYTRRGWARRVGYGELAVSVSSTITRKKWKGVGAGWLRGAPTRASRVAGFHYG